VGGLSVLPEEGNHRGHSRILQAHHGLVPSARPANPVRPVSQKNPDRPNQNGFVAKSWAALSATPFFKSLSFSFRFRANELQFLLHQQQQYTIKKQNNNNTSFKKKQCIGKIDREEQEPKYSNDKI
jgi:hypothetical protein